MAAARGHDVTLWEKKDELGGQVNVATRCLFATGIGRIGALPTAPHQPVRGTGRIRSRSHIGTRVLVEKADAVVVATGSAPYIPDLPGLEQDNVLTVWEVLMGTKPVGQRVVIIDDDGNWPSVLTAMHLAEQGKQLTIVTPMVQLGIHIDPPNYSVFYSLFYEKGAQILTTMNLKSVAGNTVIISNAFTEQETRLEPVDTVILALGWRAHADLYYSLKGKVPESHCIGDCVAPRDIGMAIYSAELIGRVL